MSGISRYAPAAAPRSHPWNDFVIQSGRTEGFGLFAASSKIERVAALEPHDEFPGVRRFNQFL